MSIAAIAPRKTKRRIEHLRASIESDRSIGGNHAVSRTRRATAQR
jgi:hypothetical protein